MAVYTWGNYAKRAMLLFGNRVYSASVNNTQVRGTKVKRNIVRVLTPEEEQQKLNKVKRKVKPSILTALPNNNNPIKIDAMSQNDNAGASTNEHEIERTSDFTFIKIGNSHDPRFGPVITDTKLRKTREKKKCILLEGNRLIKDALQAGAIPKTIFFSKMEAVEGLPLKELTVPIYKVPHHFIKLWSDMVTPPGVMAVFKMPNQGEINMKRSNCLPLTLVCDSVQDPGNLGSIIRIAAAVGCERILLTKGCVDIWEPKVLRSAAGSHFRIPLLSHLEWETVVSYFSEDSKVYVADSHYAEPSDSLDYKSNMSGKSLQEMLNSIDIPDQNEELQSGFKMDKHLSKLYTRFSLPSQVYHEVDYTDSPLVLIVGNEGNGPSPHAKKAVFDRYCGAVNVPMSAHVESLNNSVAAAVIMFEIKRQLSKQNTIYKSNEED